MAREFEDYLKDISDAMEKAQMFVAKMNYEEFIKDDKPSRVGKIPFRPFVYIS